MLAGATVTEEARAAADSLMVRVSLDEATTGPAPGEGEASAPIAVA